MFSPLYRRYALGTLSLVYMLNFLDRGLMVLLLEPIKKDLQLSDTQLGFLTGIAFALFYAVLGVPIARWADRGNRVNIASLAMGLWAITVMVCVLVTNFTQLLFARIAAAVGEAGGMAPTYSLVGDYFPGSAERTRAMTVYMLAGPLSSLLSFGMGGWLNEQFGWRLAFFWTAVPGLLLAILLKLTLIEPRQRMQASAAPQRESPGLRQVFHVLWHQRSSRHLVAAFVLLSMLGFGLAPWYAAFLMRSHAVGTQELGVWLGLIFCLSGIVGTSLGGFVASRWFADNERMQMRSTAVSVALLVPSFALFLLLPHKHQALTALAIVMVVFTFFVGPTFALMQRLVADEMRATTLALVMLLANLIGMGVGPQAVGILSDALMPYCGTDSLRYAMLATSFAALASAYHFWRVGRTVMDDLSKLGQHARPDQNAFEDKSLEPATSK